jgi:8-oxo-dGTP diphosphatase
VKTVTAAILVHEGKILIAKRGPRDHLAHKWEFPGGKIEPGETPEACLKREMQEEFQIEIVVGECLGESLYPYHHGAIRLLAYRTFWHSGELHPEVHAEYAWAAVEQLPYFDFSPADIPFVEMLMRGEIAL